MASNSPFNTGNYYGPNIGNRGANRGQGNQTGQNYPRPYFPRQSQQRQTTQKQPEPTSNDPDIQRALNVKKAKSAGVFDVMREKYNRAAEREGKMMDEQGNIVGRNSAPTQTLYAKTPTGRYKPAKTVPLTEADQPHEPTQEELDAQRQDAIRRKYAKGQSVSDDARLEAGLPDTPRQSSADIAAAKARKEQADLIAAQESEQAAAREAALTTAKEKKAAKVSSDKAYANSLKTKLMLATRELQPLEAAEKAAQSNLALPKPDKAAIAAARARRDAILKQVDEADTKVLDSTLAYQKHLDEAATEGAKIDVFKAGIKARHARTVSGITVNTNDAPTATSYDSATGRIVAGKPNTAAKPDPQQANIFRNTVEDENSPQNVDKNAGNDLINVNDPASIGQSKLMAQRMQMAQAEEDPNVSHYAQKDVEARTADPTKWEEAQYATMEALSDEDLAGKLQIMPQVIEQGMQVLEQTKLEAQAEQQGYQQKLDAIMAGAAKQDGKPFSMADSVVDPLTGQRWHRSTLALRNSTMEAAKAALAKQQAALDTDAAELERDQRVHEKRIEEYNRRQNVAEESRIKERQATALRMEKTGQAGLAGDLTLIDIEQRAKADRIDPRIERGSDEHKAAMAVIQEETQQRVQDAAKKAALLPKQAAALYQSWFKDYNSHFVDWTTNEGANDKQFPDAKENRDYWLKQKASEIGINPKDLAYQLEIQRGLDFSHPLTPGADELKNKLGYETLKKFGFLGEVEPTRVLPNGMIAVNPALGGDKDEFETFIKDTVARPEAKDEARKLWPAYHEAWLENARPVLSGAQTIPGVEGYEEWISRNLDAGNLFKDGPNGKRVLMTPNEQTEKYVEAMKGRGEFRKLMDNVSTSLLAGSHDILTAIYGVTGIAAGLGYAMTGMGEFDMLSELMSQEAGEKAKQSQALVQDHSLTGTDTILGSKLLGASISQTARILPGMALTMATGSMSGAMIAGGIQTGGMQYADTYNTLIEQGYDHKEAWLKASPAAVYSGVMTAVLTKAFPGGITALNNKANQAILRQSVGQAIKSYASGSARAAHAIARGALDEIPQEVMDEFNSQMSQAYAEGKDPKQAVSSFLANLPELIISTGVAGGLGGLGDIDGKSEGAQPGINPTAAPTGISPADAAAIDKAIKNYTGGASTPPEESSRTRNLATAVVKLRGGAALAGLTQAELTAVGYERKADKIVPIKDAQQMAYEQDGKVVITDPAIQEINDAIPATNILGLKTEAERLDEINNPPEMTEQDKQQAEGTLPKPTAEQLAKPEVEVGSATPAANATPSGQSAGVPLMVTRDMRQQLYDKGYTKQQVDAMRPQQANDILQPKASPVDAAAHEAATSPLNDKQQPTEAQQAAGNYKLGRFKLAGMTLTVEHPQGSTRGWTDQTGRKGQTVMQDHYGRILGTVGMDGDHVDAFINPGTPEDFAGDVYVIDQRDPKTGKLDEHKIMVGYPSLPAAREAYLRNYEAGWKGLKKIQAMPISQLADLVKSGKLRKSPSIKSNESNTRPAQQPPAVSTANEPSTTADVQRDNGADALPATKAAPSKGVNLRAVESGQGSVEHSPASATAPIESQLNAYIGTLKSTKAEAEAIYLRNKLLAALKPYLDTGIWKRVLVNPTKPDTAEAAMAGIGIGVLVNDKTTLTVHPQMLLHYALQASLADGRGKADKMIEAGPFHELAHTLDPNTDEQAADLWNLVDEPTQRAFAAGYFQSLPDTERAAAVDKWVNNPASHAYAGREYFRAQLEKALLGEISEEVILNKGLAKALYEMIQRLAAAINDFARTLKDKKLAGEMQAKMNAAAARFFAALPKEVQDSIRDNAAKEGRTLPGAQSQPATPARPAIGKAPPQQRIAIAKGMSGGPAYAEFASATDADAYRWYSNMRAAMNPDKKASPQAKAAIASSLLARVAEATGMEPAALRTNLIAYNKAVREQAKGVAEGEAFHAPTLREFIGWGEQQMAAPNQSIDTQKRLKQIEARVRQIRYDSKLHGEDASQNAELMALNSERRSLNRASKQTAPVATASEATSNEGGGINGPRPAGGSIQAVDTPTLTNNGKKSSQNMAAPAVSEADDRRYMAMAQDPVANREKLQAMVDKARLLPRSVFYAGDVEIIRNPSDTDYRQLNSEYKDKYPQDKSGDPTTRFTTEANGNRWIWRSDLGIHNQIEPKIESEEGVKVGQNEANWNPDASEPILKDKKTGKIIPLSERFKPSSDSMLQMAAPAAMEARKQIQSDFDEAKAEAEEDGGSFDEQRFIYNLRNGDLEEAFPDIYSDYFGNPETTNQIVYHHTPDENTDSIIENGVGAMSKTRGLNNRGVRAAVFTSAEPDPMNSYGNTVVAIDLAAARKLSGVSTSLEPAIAESIRREAVANMLGIEGDFGSYDDGSGETPDTLIIHGSVPKQAIQVSNKDGEVLFTGSEFQKSQPARKKLIIKDADGNVINMAAPKQSYRSPASMLAATKAQMQGGAGEKPAGLASMFNPQAKRPATGERTLFEMPKQSVENIRAAYASAASGKSSAYITLDELYNALKAKEPAITPKQMADMLRNMDENGEASLEISEDTGTTLRNREKYGLMMGTVPASGVAIHPRDTHILPDGYHLTEQGVQMMPKPLWHGTPHKVDEFSTNHVGKGEGNQVYGWGLYFAQNKKVGLDYKERLSNAKQRPDKFNWNGMEIDANDYKDPIRHAVAHVYFNGVASARSLSKKMLKDAKDGKDYTQDVGVPYYQKVYDVARQIKSRKEIKADAGYLYSVELLADDDAMIDWDAPLSEQTPIAQKAIRSVLNSDGWKELLDAVDAVDAGKKTMKELGRNMFDYVGTVGSLYQTVASEVGAKKLSMALNKAGVHGIRYFDGNSRTNSKDKTSNYVIFEDRLVRILEENGKPVGEAAHREVQQMGAPANLEGNLDEEFKRFDQANSGSFNRRMRQRILNKAFGVKLTNANIDRDGAHSPADAEGGSPAWDVSGNGIYPEDVYGLEGWRYYGTGEDAMDRTAWGHIQDVEGRPYASIKIYRATEKSDSSGIKPGDWVTTVRAYAADHGKSALNGDYKIVSKTVDAKDIYTDGNSWLEWGYNPQSARFPRARYSRELGRFRTPSEMLGTEQQMSAPMPQREAFYSKLAQVIEAKMPVRADAKAVRGMIGNQSSGVKAEEIRWSGINNWLDGQSGLIAKADVLAYLNGEGAVRFVEHRGGVQDTGARSQAKLNDVSLEKFGKYYGDLNDQEASEVEADVPLETYTSPTKYSQYQLPGGEYYREVVLAMPVKADKANPSKWTATQKDGKVLPWQTDNEAGALKTWEIRDENGKYVRSLPVSKFPTVEQAMAESERMYNSELETNLRGTSYTSSHFTDVPNYVAHMRLNDRSDSEGKPGTFIEEIQSDRHQQAREHGYKDSELAARLASEETEARRKVEAATEAWKADETDELWEKLRAEKRFLASAVDAATKARNEGIPDAPYRTSWPLQMFKRALAEAVSTGKKWVGWTMGQAHTDRWGTERIEWKEKDGSNGDHIIAVKEGHPSVSKGQWKNLRNLGSVSAKEIETKGEKWMLDYTARTWGIEPSSLEIRKPDRVFFIDAKSQHGGMAGDVDLEGEANARNMNAKNAATVRNKAELIEAIKPSLTEGQDPEKLGEKLWTRMQTERAGISFPRKEGFEGFYDTILPAAVNDYIKQWKNEDGSKPKVKQGMVQSVVKSATPSSMDALLDELDDDGNIKPESYPPLKQMPIWRVDITPAMKAGVEAGQALFMAAPSQQQQANIDAATYDFARPAPPTDPAHIRNARYINKRGLQSNPQLPLVSAFYTTNSLRAKMGATIRSFENDWAPFFDFINDQLPAEKRKAGLRKIVNKFAMGDKPEARALWKAYAAMPINEVLPADSERVKEARELLPYLENLTAQMMGAPKSQVTPDQDAEYMAAVESGDVAKQQAMVDAAAKAAVESNPRLAVEHGALLTKQEYQEAVDKIKPLPKRIFHVGSIEVIRNPSGDDLRGMTSEVKAKYGRDVLNDPATRFTKDKFGNTWRWKAHESTHYGMEPAITRAEGVEVNQNNQIPDHWEVVKDAVRAGSYLPPQVQAENERYKDFIKPSSSNPVTRDAEGNVIPLSQRFNDQSNDIRYMGAPKDQGDLDSRVLKRLADQLPSSEEFDILDSAAAESFPEMSDTEREIAMVYAVNMYNTPAQTFDEWDKAAKKLIKNDRKGVIDELVNNFYEGKDFGGPIMARAAIILSSEMVTEAGLSGDEEFKRRAYALAYAAANGKGQQARGLRALASPLKSNRERVVEVMQKLLVTPPAAVRAKIAAAPSPAAKLKKIAALQKRIKELEKQIVSTDKAAQKAAREGMKQADKDLKEALATEDKAELVDKATKQREKKIKGVMEADGMTIEDLLITPEERLAMQDSELVKRARAKHTKAEQKPLEMMGKGFGDEEIAKLNRMEKERIAALREDFRNRSLKPEIAREVKKGRSILDVIKDAFKTFFNVQQMAAPKDRNLNDMRRELILDGLASGDAAIAAVADEAAQRFGITVTPEEVAAHPKPKKMDAGKLQEKLADILGKLDASAEIDKWLNMLCPTSKRANSGKLFQAYAKGKNGKQVTVYVPFDADNFKSIMKEAHKLSIAEATMFDKVYEGWISGILSGIGTQVANFTGTLSSTIDHFGPQRALQTLLNQIWDDQDSPRAGEIPLIPKGMKSAIWEGGKIMPDDWSSIKDGMKHILGFNGPVAKMAWLSLVTEADPLAHVYLNEPVEIEFKPDGSIAKFGGFRGPAIGGIKGKAVRFIAGVLRVMDVALKTFNMHAEVAAQAYRLGVMMRRRGEFGVGNDPQGKPFQYKDLSDFIDKQVSQHGSAAWALAMGIAEVNSFQDASSLGYLAGRLAHPLSGEDKRAEMEAAIAASDGDKIKAMMLMNKAASMGFVEKFMKYKFPFVRTIVNLGRWAVRRSPLGSFNLLNDIGRKTLRNSPWGGVALPIAAASAIASPAVAGISLAGLTLLAITRGYYSVKANGKPFFTDYPSAHLIRGIAEQAQAWAVLALMFKHIEGDRDDDKKKLLFVGGRPYGTDESVDAVRNKYGSTYVIVIRHDDGTETRIPFGKYDPVSSVLGTTIDSVRRVKEMYRRRALGEAGGDPASAVRGMFTDILNQVTDKSILRGFSDLFSSLDALRHGKDPSVGFLDQTKKELVRAIVPNIIRSSLRAGDDTVRDSRKTEGVWNDAIPNGDYAEAMIDEFGREVMKGGTWWSRIFFTPANAQREEHPIEPFIDEWNKDHFKESIDPVRMQRDDYYVYGMDGKEHVLLATPKEKTDFEKRVGQAYSERLKTVAANLAQQQKEGGNVMTDALPKAIKKAREDSRKQVRQTYLISPSPSSPFLAAKQKQP